jgi:ElaB/YqjD/DUF883 family membrane-anchored ribosome-binding protein
MATANQEIRDLRAELEQLRASISAEAKNGHYRVRENMSTLAKDVREDAEELAHNAGISLRKAWNRGRLAASDAYAQYESSVVRHPLSSTAMAFAGGMLLAALLRRR